METENNSKGSGSKSRGVGGGELIIAFAYLVIAFLVFLAVVYGVVLGLSAGAIYLGVKLGSSGQLGTKPRHQKVKDIEAEKQEHLKELEGESPDLIDLAQGSFENEKMELYRPKDEVAKPGIDLEKAKEVVKLLINRIK